MRYTFDHDLHIHTVLSVCADGDKDQNVANIIKYAEKNNLKHVCITDHYWDENVEGASGWYAPQNYEHIKQSLPFPESPNVNVHFGCEIDMDKNFRIGIADKTFEKFEFVVIPTTHLHFMGFTIDPKDNSIERRTALYVERLDKLLSMNLPFEKIGIAHLTCGLIAPNGMGHLDVLNGISDQVYTELFTKLAKKGAGFELNFAIEKYNKDELPQVLRPYLIAKRCGCKFYVGSDAHHQFECEMENERANKIIDALDLDESDKFHPAWKK